MKRHLLFTLLITFALFLPNNLFSQVNQDWQWVSPAPQGNSLRWVKALSATEWVAIGSGGTFMKTTDAGENWIVNTSAGGRTAWGFLGNSLNSGWFFNSNTGVVCGSGAWVARTTNGGLNWDSCSAPAAPNFTFSGLHFINNLTGFMSGTTAILFKTTDGGYNWLTMYIPIITYNFTNVYALDENHIYAAASNYLVSTTNGGANWRIDTTQVSASDVYFSDVNTGFVCGSNGAVKMTTNGGLNWVSKNTGSTFTLNCLLGIASTTSRLAFTENFDGTAFPPAGWKVVNVKGSAVWVRTVAQSHSAPASALINYDCDSTGGLDWLITPQISVNAGDSLVFWLRPLDVGYPPDSLCVRVSTTDTSLSSFTTRILYLREGAGYPDSLVWNRYSVSLNAFASQNIYIGFKHQDSCGDGIHLDDVSVISQGSSSLTLYAVGDTGYIYKTINNGDNWTAINILDPAQYNASWAYYSMDLSGSNLIVGGTNGIFNLSTNSGANWSCATHRQGRGGLYDVSFKYGVGKVWACGAPTRVGITFDQVIYSTNGGKDFQNQTVSGSYAQFNSMCMVDENTGYISGTFGAIRKTVNGGTAWDSLITPIPNNLSLNSINFINANTGWVFSNTANATGTVWHTTNGGVNWEQQVLEDTSSSGKRVSRAFMMNANTGYCMNMKGAVNMTTNGGANWFIRLAPPNLTSSSDIFMVNDSTGFASASSKLFSTKNRWLTVDTMALPVASSIAAIHWIDEENGFFLTTGGLPVRTTTGGKNWEIMMTSTSSLSNLFAKTIDTAYVVGSNRNILKLQKGLVGITWKPSVPEQFFLAQNYPNPFNPATTIMFGLKSKGTVSLKIYDITGRLVQSYFDNTPLNAGTVILKFDGKDFASGIYFYTLTVDDKRIDTKKMVLIK